MNEILIVLGEKTSRKYLIKFVYFNYVEKCE
jgi:hypothetical protein